MSSPDFTICHPSSSWTVQVSYFVCFFFISNTVWIATRLKSTFFLTNSCCCGRHTRCGTIRCRRSVRRVQWDSGTEPTNSGPSRWLHRRIQYTRQQHSFGKQWVKTQWPALHVCSSCVCHPPTTMLMQRICAATNLDIAEKRRKKDNTCMNKSNLSDETLPDSAELCVSDPSHGQCSENTAACLDDDVDISTCLCMPGFFGLTCESCE